MGTRSRRESHPGTFGWEEQTYFVLARDYGLTRRPSPAELDPYAVAGLSATEAARRHAAAHGSTAKPCPQPTPRAEQPRLFD